MAAVNPLAAVWKKRGLSLYEFQEEGIAKMIAWREEGHGGINADEMGLGKTCQTIVTMVNHWKAGLGPFLVISPLSVCPHWVEEVERFACGKLKPVAYVGYQPELKEIVDDLTFHRETVLICPYNRFIDYKTHKMLRAKMGQFKFSTIVVDEAQVIKNSEVQMSHILKLFYADAIYLLLTGTPIQNSLAELYSLLTFVDRKSFPSNGLEGFLENYDNPQGHGELSQMLKKYMIRRTKKEVFDHLPDYHEVVLFHDLSALQRNIYKDIISKNYEAFKIKDNKIRLTNVVMEIRKCVFHPYLLKGVEPQPLEEGEHMVETSGKMQVLERLLRYLKERGHRCLIFSFFKIGLDVVQDFIEYRGWSCVRIDGSTMSSDRELRIRAFQSGKGKKNIRDDDDEEPWIFMATTKTGGVGLNLTAADTVIFLDTDWNPQNDIQAMARCHRIGQTKRVRVIRLAARYTIDQYMLIRARNKLKLSDAVMENDEAAAMTAVELTSAIKSNLGDLMDRRAVKKFDCTDEELERVIGKTDRKGEWAPLSEEQQNFGLNVDDGVNDVDVEDPRKYQGVSYRISERDDIMFHQLLNNQELQGRKRKRTVINYRAQLEARASATPSPTKDTLYSPPVKQSTLSKLPLALRIDKTKANVEAWLKKGKIDLDDEDLEEEGNVTLGADASGDDAVLVEP